jgi:hypothetical protein
VRLCDGFYFPVSEASQPANFLADEKTCQARCTAPAKLFYQNVFGDEAETMVALTGERYTALANAFRYRDGYDEACACRPKPWSAEAKAEYERRAIIAARTPLQRVVAAGANESGEVLAGNDRPVVAAVNKGGSRAKVNTTTVKSRYSRAAPEKTRVKTRSRPVRYSADLPAVNRAQRAVPEQPKRRCFLFCNR